MSIQIAKKEDIKGILKIYNDSIALKIATADTEEVTIESMNKWFESHSESKYPIFVYKKGAKILGYNNLSPYRNGRKALSTVLETSYYVDKEYHKKGIATELMNFAIKWCKNNSIETLITFILAHNDPSIQLMHKFGFEKWGILPQVAKFDDKVYDHIIFGRKLI